MDNKSLIYSIVTGIVFCMAGAFYVFSATNLNNLSSRISSQRQVLQPTPQVDFAEIRSLGIFEREEFFALPIDVLELSLGKQDPFAN